MNAAIGRIMDIADKINAMCDSAEASDGLRTRCHGYHGEMVARGAGEEDILRVVASMIEASKA